MSDIFLSYKSEDKDKAHKIAETIEQNGYSVWWDRIIPIGREFDDVIQEELDAAKCIVVLWSNKSVASKWVKTEAHDGNDRGILVPILIENVTPCLSFRRIEAANLVEWDGTSSYHEFQLLLESISKILGRPQVTKTEILKTGKNIIENNKRSMQMVTKKILLINTGGPIAPVPAEKQDQDARNTDDFAERIKPTISYFKNEWNFELEIDSEELCNVSGSDILPEHWVALVELIVKNYDDYDAFIITHGTNILGYTCAALSFALANLNKPVILTGSQVLTGIPGSDALTNLNNAIQLAVWPYENTMVKGVVAVFGSHIITGTRVKKNTEFDYDAFQSFTTASIGRIGRYIKINEENLKKHNAYLETKFYNRALTSKDLIVENEFDMRIASLTEFPGMSNDIFKNLVEINGIKGFIFRAFGAGDVSHYLHSSLEYLKAKEIPIVVTTQIPNGNSNFQVNEEGQHLKEYDLAIPAYDMSIESQTTKLAWLLAKKNKGKLRYEDVKREMITDYRGEINVLIEKRP